MTATFLGGGREKMVHRSGLLANDARAQAQTEAEPNPLQTMNTVIRTFCDYINASPLTEPQKDLVVARFTEAFLPPIKTLPDGSGITFDRHQTRWFPEEHEKLLEALDTAALSASLACRESNQAKLLCRQAGHAAMEAVTSTAAVASPGR